MEKRRGEWGLRGRLLPFVERRDTEGYALVVVGLGGCGQVEFCERNLFCALGSEVPKRLADDSVIVDLLLVLIAEDENCVRHDGSSRLRVSRRGARRRSRASVGVLIAVGFFSPEHLLLLEALLVHVVGDLSITLVVFVVGRTCIPPPVRINAAVTPRIVTTPTSVAEAVVAEAEVAEVMIASAEAVTVEAEASTGDGPAREVALRE